MERTIEINKTRWYVLYTAPRAEKLVEKRLRGEGVEVFLPLIKSKRKWSDRIKVVELPLFYSYIFVHCPVVKLRTLVVVPGVVRVVYYLGRPAIVKDFEIDVIKDFLKMSEGNTVISKGNIVDILIGPLEKKSGEVVKLNEKYAYLYLEEIGATVCIEMDKVSKVAQ